MRARPHGPGHASRALSRRLCKAAFYALWLLFFAWMLGGLLGFTSKATAAQEKTQQAAGTGEATTATGGAGGATTVTGAAVGPGVVSSATIQVVPNAKGELNKYFYRFKNVQLTRKALRFFYPKGFVPPSERWVDYISGNSSVPELPTKLVIKGEVTSILTYYMDVKYEPAEEQQPECKGWIDKPAFLLQVRYAGNIWHSWNEGLMGTFQTLRELGYLPLVQIDDQGYMREVMEGMGGPDCFLEYDPVTGKAKPGTDCQKTGVVTKQRCDPATQNWCTKGVVSHRRFDGGPTIVYYTDASVHNRWRHLYFSMTEDIRSLDDLEGYCYRNLIVGKTSTLNFYQNNLSNITDTHIKARKEALAVFKHYVLTAQQQAIAVQQARDPNSGQFGGYAPPSMELLRRGIGPENINLADAIAKLEMPANGLEADMGTLQPGWEVEAERFNREAEQAAKAASAAGAATGVTTARRRRSANRRLAQQTAAKDGGVGATQTAEQEEEAAVQAAADAADAAAAAETTGAVAGGAVGTQTTTAEAGAASDAQALAEAAAKVERVEAAVAEARDAEAEAARAAAAIAAMPSLLVPDDAPRRFEPYRPVVTYMCRPFFSRGVLNEVDILRYILSHYNVTLRVTTFQEPLLEVLDLMGHTDVLVGMHGAGWTNALFVKHGASGLQLYPYGWRLPRNGRTIRGANYKEIVLASDVEYTEWVNDKPGYAFFRRTDFHRNRNNSFLHPGLDVPRPADGLPGPPWVYQNTYVDMTTFGPAIEAVMAGAGIPKMSSEAAAAVAAAGTLGAKTAGVQTAA